MHPVQVPGDLGSAGWPLFSQDAQGLATRGRRATPATGQAGDIPSAGHLRDGGGRLSLSPQSSSSLRAQQPCPPRPGHHEERHVRRKERTQQTPSSHGAHLPAGLSPLLRHSENSLLFSGLSGGLPLANSQIHTHTPSYSPKIRPWGFSTR